MDGANLQLAESLLSKSYVLQGQQALKQRHNLVKSLLSNKRLPDTGWDDASIEWFLQDLSMMDSNNFLDNVGMGEREAKCASPLVWKRHYGMAHGIGRSGSITDEQPKAAGSTLLAKLSNALVKDSLEIAGLKDIGAVSVLPLATGMTLMLSLMALKKRRPPAARYVLWPRMDQKSCLKCILAAGLEVVVIPNRLEGDQLRTDVAAIQAKSAELGSDQIVCVLTTTSCFATRAPDRVEEVAKLCQKLGVGHIINNAYGVQCAVICGSITQAWRRGRVDAVIQSTDKNFLVPVGGAVIAAGSRECSLVDAMNRAYPGRASMSPLMDVFITLLSLGKTGWKKVLADREVTYAYLKQRLTHVAEAQGERLLHTPDNPISLALTLTTLDLRQPVQSTTKPCAAAAPGQVSLGNRQEPVGAVPLQPAASDIGPASVTAESTARSTGNTHAEEGVTSAPPEGAREGAVGGRDTAATGEYTQGVTEAAQLRREDGDCAHPSEETAELRQRLPEHDEAGGSVSGHVREDEGSVSAGVDSGGEPAEPGDADASGPDGAGRPATQGGGRKPSSQLTFFGSMLFARCVSGSRVIPRGDDKVIEGIPFAGFGSSYDKFPYSYMTAAAAIGSTCEEVDTFITRLERCFADFRKKFGNSRRPMHTSELTNSPLSS
ncbi:O-phospho-L-seryl-tRNASec:L-selenocysteinyl-tRNA synthase [Klebsormidium nitens]|uniref:O-phosphoseryl-tRNA(Sec) selenium transferase n=1 Tax=Klebsormidium nitens TaxID=105231 RepID=A0A1Y1I1V3_KLENI|nr:O-phospho-L-seryl-tRNASec:L-selenocysteinyl-tRNA synthase [Klebsormidium nitens]|eukprot:GAQ82108.1 O-phospho-L-seryl-tRNASec:L-selenocysteinyl-tRNA synthase [Klebsormidium nitens]